MKDKGCPKCLSSNEKMIQLYGKTKAGQQRYKCVKCSKTFTPKDIKIFKSSCPKCYSSILYCVGKTKAGQQRYKCVKCGKKFSAKVRQAGITEERIKKIELIIDTTLGKRLSLRQTAKDLNIPFPTIRNLFFEGIRSNVINPKNLSIPARIEFSQISKLKANKIELEECLVERGSRCAVNHLKKIKDEDSKKKTSKNIIAKKKGRFLIPALVLL